MEALDINFDLTSIDYIYNSELFLLTILESLLGISLGIFFGFLINLATPNVSDTDSTADTLIDLTINIILAVFVILIVLRGLSNYIGVFDKNTIRGSTSSIFFMFGFFFGQTDFQKRINLLFTRFVQPTDE